MGIASSVEDKAQTFLLASKLLDIRQQKKQVEMQQSMQLAVSLTTTPPRCPLAINCDLAASGGTGDA